ncbi:MobP3 family relaxase, partial [Desulfotruncus alcoholivorax]|uniref:MobP3 family relaxase n=1 Tax=Desulfotruncus alcoholivorax TaxID=265477 RepID=UPI00068526DA
MPPFVLKIKFYKPGGDNCGKNAAHVNYIATRPGADRGDINIGDRDSELRKDDFELDSPAGHVKYAAERPRSHGLFGADEKPPDLEEVREELGQHDGIVWRFVLSLREDMAKRMGYIDRKSWENALRAGVPEAAQAMGIPESNLRWVAAYHAEAGHPHVHLVMWEKETHRNRGVLSPGERRDVRKAFIRSIYAAERSRLGVEKTAIRDMVRDVARGEMDRVNELIVRVKSEHQVVQAMDGGAAGVVPRLSDDDREDLAGLVENLAKIMPGKGRVALKYMPEEVKAGAREIADWILSKPGFSASSVRYREIAREMAGHYTSQEQKLNQAEENAYSDLRDRVSQLVLKTAAQVRVEEPHTEGEAYTLENGSSYDGRINGGKFIVPNTENVAENLWRGAGRATTRALYRVDP